MSFIPDGLIFTLKWTGIIIAGLFLVSYIITAIIYGIRRPSPKLPTTDRADFRILTNDHGDYVIEERFPGHWHLLGDGIAGLPRRLSSREMAERFIKETISRRVRESAPFRVMDK